MAPLPPSKNIKSCYNPKCQYYNRVSAKAPLKCGRCKTAHYCDKDCQKAHWSYHKEFCQVWADSAKNNGEIPVIAVKKKMTQLIWLIRGIPEYTRDLFREFLHWQRQGRRGCIEFYFEKFEDVFEAVRVLEALPIVDRKDFYPNPLAPTYTEKPDKTPIAQKLPIRTVTDEHEEAFVREVDNRMTFCESTSEARPNMMKCLELLGDNENMFLISVTVKLQGTYSTHMFDFIYKRLSWYPEDGPWPPKKQDK
ncbi:hypothetical protein BDZ97DRAFT_1656914 [Flammula alnicola]|nr:hypothetical protein BDZ97DRAFT_1656914 [Flammula alnicola]